MAGLIIPFAIQYKDIARLGCIDSLMKRQIITREAGYGESASYHFYGRINWFNRRIHDTLMGYVRVVICDISGWELQ